MVAYADSSFLVALYADDRHADSARLYLQKNPNPIALTSFSKGETQHALRMCAFRGDISEEEMTQYLLLFEQDQDEGLYEPVRLDADELFQKAAQLSQRYTRVSGVRYLDMLHVASALLAKSRRFLTFDQRQRKLAKQVGLESKP